MPARCAKPATACRHQRRSTNSSGPRASKACPCSRRVVDQVQPALNRVDIAAQPVHTARKRSLAGLKQPQTLLDLNNVGTDVGNVCADRAQQLQYEVVAHAPNLDVEAL